MPELPEEPLNREPALHALISSFLTPVEEGYDRNHGIQPDLDASTYRIKVNGEVSKQLSLSISDLEHNFPQHDVVCALQCAGNRRHTMRVKLKGVQGIEWYDGAVMNCKWTGARLKDVLNHAGISLSEQDKHSAHVAFSCSTQPCQEDTWYGASIPLSRALRDDADVILALKMNGQVLTKKHGYPARIIAPGITGARSVKWVDEITVQREESRNHYMQYDYKVLPPKATDSEKASEHWGTTPPVQEMPVNSTIAIPAEGTSVERDADGCITVAGYATPSGDDGPVTKVEVSGDGGKTWTEAELIKHKEEGKWSWKLWQCKLKVGAGKRTIYSRATDAAGNTQPERSQWNLRGVCYNGYGEAADVTVT